MFRKEDLLIHLINHNRVFRAAPGFRRVFLLYAHPLWRNIRTHGQKNHFVKNKQTPLLNKRKPQGWRSCLPLLGKLLFVWSAAQDRGGRDKTQRKTQPAQSVTAKVRQQHHRGLSYNWAHRHSGREMADSNLHFCNLSMFCKEIMKLRI